MEHDGNELWASEAVGEKNYRTTDGRLLIFLKVIVHEAEDE